MSDTADLLTVIESYWRRFLIATEEQIVGLTVWTAHTYMFEAFHTTPYLIVTSAEMRSGKSLVLEILDCIAHRARYTTSMTEAVLFRLIDAEKPTLLMDEQDRALKERHGELSERQENIIGIINMGYRKKGQVGRVTPQRDLEWHSVYCPKALAGIGRMPATIEDRGLPIRMVRMGRDDETAIEEFDDEVGYDEAQSIRDLADGWASGARLRLAGVKPDMPLELDRRAKQSYRVLACIADDAGGPWPERVRDALVVLREVAAESPKESQGMRLLRDIAVLADRLRMERIATHDLLAWLYEHGEQPWEDWWGESAGKKAARRLALVLGEYGVKPTKWKDGGDMFRGYETAPILSAVKLYADNTPPNATVPDLQDFCEDATRHPNGSGGVLGNGANPHGQREVAFGGVLNPKSYEVGSVGWIGQASMDELREWQDNLDTDAN